MNFDWEGCMCNEWLEENVKNKIQKIFGLNLELKKIKNKIFGSNFNDFCFLYSCKFYQRLSHQCLRNSIFQNTRIRFLPSSISCYESEVIESDRQKKIDVDGKVCLLIDYPMFLLINSFKSSLSNCFYFCIFHEFCPLKK